MIETRKIIQFQYITSSDLLTPQMIVLCEDGTMWTSTFAKNEWVTLSIELPPKGVTHFK